MPRESNDLTAVIPRWSNYYSQNFYFLLCIFPYILNQNNKKRKKKKEMSLQTFLSLQFLETQVLYLYR